MAKLPQQLDWTACSDQLADSVITCRYLVRSKKVWAFLCGPRTICAHWRRTRWTMEQTCCQGTTSPQGNGRSTHSRFRKFGKSWQSLSRPLHLRRQLSLPSLFSKEHGCPCPQVAQSSALCFPSSHSATAGTL